MDNKQFQEKEKYVGHFNGMEVRFNRVWSDYRFTDEECEALLAGEEIHIRPTSKKTGKEYDCYGKLVEQEYNGNKFFGFQPDFKTKRVPTSFGDYKFSKQELKDLEEGRVIYCNNLTSKKGTKYNAYFKFTQKDGLKMSFTNEEA